jgi:hypothetical protein
MVLMDNEGELSEWRSGYFRVTASGSDWGRLRLCAAATAPEGGDRCRF